MKRILSAILVLCALLSLCSVAFAAENPYTLSGSWKFNDRLTAPATILSQELEFTCDVREAEYEDMPHNYSYIYRTLTCHKIRVNIDVNDPDYLSVRYFHDVIYADGGIGLTETYVYGHSPYQWVAPWGHSVDNAEYINIIGEQEVSKEFYEWFMANATPYNVKDKVSTVLKYGMDVGYTVTIPENVAMNSSGGASSAITIENAMLLSNQRVDITVNSNNYDANTWNLTETTSGEKLQYTITNADGALTNGGVVLTANAGEIWNTSKTSNLSFALVNAATKAGNYVDTLTFTVNLNEMAISINDDLSGSYKMLTLLPTVETAIYVEGGPGGLAVAKNLLSQYGIPVDSGANLREDYYLTAITPWLYYFNENGEAIFFGIGLADNGIANHGDATQEELFLLLNRDLIPEEMMECKEMTYFYLDYMSFWNQEFSVSAETSATISDEVKTAFMASYEKIDNGARDYFAIELQSPDGTNVRMNMYQTTWNTLIHSDINAQAAKVLGVRFISVDNTVYLTNDAGVATPVTRNGIPVQVTDVILKRYEPQNQEYFNNIYNTDLDAHLVECPYCGQEGIKTFPGWICDEHGVCFHCHGYY